jgi:hypothetical protein
MSGGDVILQNKIKIYGINRPTKNPLSHSRSGFLNVFYYIGTNKPLYCLTLPGLILGVAGLYTGLRFLQAFHPGGSFDLEQVVFAVLLTLVGTILAFMGILLHSIAGLIRYRSNKL